MTRTTLVLNTDYVTIGELPGTFPYDPPDLFEVTFTDWHGDFPYRIEFYVPASDMHGPEHPNPLYWNPRIRKFQDSPP